MAHYMGGLTSARETERFFFGYTFYMYRRWVMRMGALLVFAAVGLAMSQDFLAHYSRVVQKEAAAADGVLVSPLETRTVSPDYFLLITEPSAGVTPVLTRIQHAQKSVDLVMYSLEDTQVVQALGEAEACGVQVRVLLNGGYYAKHEGKNDGAYSALQKLGVPVKWTPTYFALTHQKTLVIDGSDALVMTFNVQAQYYKTGRDFAVDDTDPADVQAIEQAFESDWNGKQATATQGDTLLWSPGSQDELLYLINSATSTLDIYNEEMADADITEALVQAAKRGVVCRVDMTYATNWKPAFTTLSNAGVHIRTWASSSNVLYIHAKMIVVDGHTVFLGSENFSDTSLNKNRELGLVLNAPQIIDGVQGIFDADWAKARPFVPQN